MNKKELLRIELACKGLKRCSKCKLDKELILISDIKAQNNPIIRQRLYGGKFTNVRTFNPLYDVFKSDGTTTELNLFGEFASKIGLTKVKKKVP